eukprot:scaffold153884_cov39-Prasinocladus_malaysianus.AAC.1
MATKLAGGDDANHTKTPECRSIGPAGVSRQRSLRWLQRKRMPPMSKAELQSIACETASADQIWSGVSCRALCLELP